MSALTIGIVDYGVGNHASVWRSLHDLGFRCRVTGDRAVLDKVDVILLPGVGAFAPAMAALHQRDLAEYLRDQGRLGRPFLGICLGMQLLAERSHENGLTEGLGLIPGEVVALAEPRWHIGWNQVSLTRPDALLAPCDGADFYFNHSYTYAGPAQFQAGLADNGYAFPVLLRSGSVIGMQFHPEKSQDVGRRALRAAIGGLCGA